MANLLCFFYRLPVVSGVLAPIILLTSDLKLNIFPFTLLTTHSKSLVAFLFLQIDKHEGKAFLMFKDNVEILLYALDCADEPLIN